MFDGTKIRTERIGNQDVTIMVTASGKFGATFGEGDGADDYFADTLADLVVKLKAAERAERPSHAIQISLVDWNPGWRGEGPARGVLDVILRGQNQRTRAWLLSDQATGKKFSVDTYSSMLRHFVRRMTPDEVATYQALAGAADAAQGKLQGFLAGLSIDPKELLLANRTAAEGDRADT